MNISCHVANAAITIISITIHVKALEMAAEYVYKQGTIVKRGRGRKAYKSPFKHKFQERYCQLTGSSLVYFEKEGDTVSLQLRHKSTLYVVYSTLLCIET